MYGRLGRGKITKNVLSEQHHINYGRTDGHGVEIAKI